MPVSRRDLFRALAGAAVLPVVASCGGQPAAPAWYFKADDPEAPVIETFLDGMRVSTAFEAHTGEGWVCVYAINDDGYGYEDAAGETVMTTLYGRVEFRRGIDYLPPRFAHLAAMPVMTAEERARPWHPVCQAEHPRRQARHQEAS